MEDFSSTSTVSIPAPTGRIVVTRHALGRYRERIKLEATPSDVEDSVRRSTPVKGRLSRLILAAANYGAFRRTGKAPSPKPNDRFTVNPDDGSAFFLRLDNPGTFVVVTVYSLRALEDLDRRTGRKGREGKGGLRRGSFRERED